MKTEAVLAKEFMTNKEDKRSWQEKFQDCVDASTDEEVKHIWNLLSQADDLKGEITEEQVSELEHMIKYANVHAIYKTNFNRKVKLLANRVDRAISENFGSFVKHLREIKGYSLKDLQTKTGISASYINRIEKTERKAPSYKIIEKLATALGQEVGELLNVANLKEPEEMTNVEELLVSSSFMINDKRATKEAKERLVELISKINQADWGANKHKEAMAIMDAIERYKSSFVKKEKEKEKV